MKYLKVKWFHSHPDEPIEIYGEIDKDGWEVRKVERFRDGTTTYASPFHQIGTTWLAEVPITELAEINADSQFEGEWINQHDFERIWLMSSEMITIHKPQLVQSIQAAIGQRQIDMNEFVEQAIQHYLEDS